MKSLKSQLASAFPSVLDLKKAVEQKALLCMYSMMLTMSLCSRLALLASSSFTTSTWPSLEAEISAVQQSWQKKDKKPHKSLTSRLDVPLFTTWSTFSRFRTYQLVIPSSHECPNSLVNNAQWSCNELYETRGVWDPKGVWMFNVITQSFAEPQFCMPITQLCRPPAIMSEPGGI